MDSRRYFHEEYLNLLYQTYKYKYSDSHFDAIISTDNNAFQFLLQYHEELFPGVPIVFGGLNDYDETMVADHDEITGILEAIDLEGTLAIALKFHPNTKQVLVISDQTIYGQRSRADLEALVEQGRIPVDVVFLDQGDGLELTELLDKLKSAPEDSIVLNTGFAQDKNGVTMLYENIMPLLSEASNAPIYIVADFHLGHGAVGGKLVSGYHHGMAVGELVTRILQGELPSEIPIRPGPTIDMFDYRQLQRWGIPLSMVPDDSVIINKPDSFFDRYRDIFWAIILFGLIQTTVISFLLFNIVQRRKAEKTLRESEKRYRSLFEMSPLPIAVHADNKVIFMNSEAVRVLRAESERELIGKSVLSVIHPDYQDMVKKRVNQLYSQDVQLEPLEEKFVCLDGTVIDVEVMASTIDYEGKHASQVIFRDITERKEAEKQRLDLAVERERVNVLKQFIADISHDFKTPLATIKTSLYLLKRKLPHLVDYQRHLDALEIQSSHLARMVDDMLSMSRLDALQEFELESVDLNALIQEIMADQEDRAADKRLVVKAVLDTDVQAIRADREQLYRAITNIVENAMHYTPDGGRITVRTSGSTELAVVEIADTGIGISTHDLPHVFDRFYRGERTRSSPLTGTGLGLPIARRIIEMHNGSISVESQPGTGSKFRITLPGAGSLDETGTRSTEM